MKQSWAVTLGSIGGTLVRIHLTFVLLLGWVAVTAWSAGGLAAALGSLIFVIALFACVLLHELGHVAAARQFGIATPDITLYPIGGMARIQSRFENPRQELVIASAGPAVSLGLALLLLTLSGGRTPSLDFGAVTGWRDGLALLAFANLSLFLFNLLPAFPMDGGRIFRSLLALRIGHDRATRIASVAGRMIGVGLGVYGAAIFHPILMLIGAFVFLAASSEASEVELRTLLGGKRVADVMASDVRMLRSIDTIAASVDLLIETEQLVFPVLDPRGVPLGSLSRTEILVAVGRDGPGAIVATLLERPAQIVSTDVPAGDALTLLEEHGDPVFAVDGEGRTAGIVTWNNLAEVSLVDRALRRNATAVARAAPI